MDALGIESCGFEAVFYARCCMQTSENSLPRTRVNKGERGSRRSPSLLRIRSVEEDGQQRCHHDKHPNVADYADVSHLHVPDHDPDQPA